MKGNYIKIFVSALVAAGLICIVAGLIMFFAVDSSSGMVTGMIFIVVGALDTIISLLILFVVLFKDRLDKSADENNKNKKDK